MLYSITAQATFDTTHQASSPSSCAEHLHGHTFLLRATTSHEELDQGIPRGAVDFQRAVQSLAREFDHRTLKTMALVEDPTHVNLAAYCFERLSAEYKGLRRVEVYADEMFGVVEKQ